MPSYVISSKISTGGVIHNQTSRRAENISELCRREGICPKDYYRYRDKVVEGAMEALRRNGRKKRDPEKEFLKIAGFSLRQRCKLRKAKSMEYQCPEYIDFGIQAERLINDGGYARRQLQ